MIDYLRPVATAASAPPYEVLFQLGGNGTNMLWYMNGGDKPHCAKYRPADSVNAEPLYPALFHSLDVIVGGLPEETEVVNVRPADREAAEALRRECMGRKQATIARKSVTFHF